jgi:hypothetical protein
MSEYQAARLIARPSLDLTRDERADTAQRYFMTKLVRPNHEIGSFCLGPFRHDDDRVRPLRLPAMAQSDD